jgi:hypothetical protein
MNPDAASGPFYPDNKDDAMRMYGPEIQHYIEHPFDYEVPLWTFSPKLEHLSFAKIAEDKQRGLAYPPIHHLLLEKTVFGELDEYLKKLPITGYGKSPFFGGYHSLLGEVAKYKYKFKGDITKMDVHSIPEQWKALAEIRKAVSDSSLHRYIDYCYEQKAHTPLWLTDGSIIWADTQQKSGSGATSSDNTWWHLLIFIYMALVVAEIDGFPIDEWDDFIEFVLPVMFSDDHVGGTRSRVLSSLKVRSMLYKRFGYTLKPEEDLETEDVCDLTFLGGKCAKSPYGYVPVYDGDKMLSLFLAREKKNTKPEVIYSTLLSYCLLTFWSGVHFNVFYSMLSKHCELYGFDLHTVAEFRSMFRPDEVSLFPWMVDAARAATELACLVAGVTV